MTERLKILEHHVENIRRDFLIFGKGEKLSAEIKNYTESRNSLRYPFSDEKSRQNFSRAFESAVIAVLDNNFEKISDYKDYATLKKQNFDLICFSCPNYKEGMEICPLVKDESGNMNSNDSWMVL